MQSYAAENGGRYPDGVEALLLTQDLTAEVFICPSSQGERAPGDTAAEQARHLSNPLHMTFVYVGKGRTAPPSRADATILAHEHPGNHNNQGMNFLYADGHVEFQGKEVSQHLAAEIAAGHNPPRSPQSARSAGK